MREAPAISGAFSFSPAGGQPLRKALFQNCRKIPYFDPADNEAAITARYSHPRF
jgi:hypothetical protein